MRHYGEGAPPSVDDGAPGPGAALRPLHPWMSQCQRVQANSDTGRLKMTRMLVLVGRTVQQVSATRIFEAVSSFSKPFFQPSRAFLVTFNMSKKLEIPSENKAKCPVVVAGDPKTQKQGVVVLQEWWGLNQQIQDEAAELGKLGNFVTIVPDLYRGKVATNNEDAGHYMGELDWEGAVKDIQACARYLKKEGCSKVGVTGFCMGGALSLAAAAKVPEIDAAAPFYGIPGADLADVSKIKVPLQCHFGDLDDIAGFSDLAAQEKLKQQLDGGKVNYEFFCYEGCKHAFTNATSPNFNKEAFHLSFKRLVEFFQTKLK